MSQGDNNYRPLPNEVTVKPSPIQGLGLFATKNILYNALLGISHVYSPGFKDNYIRTPLGGFINHAQDPNCELHKIGDYLYLRIIRNIDKGDELTLKYSLYTLP